MIGSAAVAGATPASDSDLAESRLPEISAGTHFAALDGYRAIAALMVVLTHIAFQTGFVESGFWGQVLDRFDFGVPLFFLMSGFLLYRPWARAALEGRPRPNLRRYAVRRVARIMPLYLVVVVVTLHFLREIQPVSWQQWVQHLLAIQIYVEHGQVEGLTQTWSLCTEIAFYAALPVIGWLALGRRTRSLDEAWRRQLVMLALLVVVALVWNITRTRTTLLPEQAGNWLPGYLDWFAAGMALALVEVRSRLPGRPRLVRVALAAGRDEWTSLVIALGLFSLAVNPLAGSFDLHYTGPWETLAKHTLYLGAATFFLLPGVLAQSGRVATALSRPTPHRLGLISYGVFLWHLVLLRFIMSGLGIPFFGGHTVQVGVLTVVSTIVVSTVTYRWIERPPQAWAHRV
jgi:peptidoglycan/LPS O-acetylase OafA/YrhL